MKKCLYLKTFKKNLIIAFSTNTKNTTPPATNLVNLAELIRERRKMRCTYIKCEYLSNADTIKPETHNLKNETLEETIFPTCTIKQETEKEENW